jgi:GNAT superfamily N-acetyltransferase
VEQVSIRSAQMEDVERLIELLEHGSLADPTARSERPSEIDRYRAALAEIQTTAGNDVLVAEIAGDVVGMCQLVIFRHFQAEGGLCCEIESVHVHPEFRSKGIGAQLVSSAAEIARRAGCYRVQLTSNLRRPRAHQFYEREGFEPSHVGFKRVIEAG